MQVMSNINSSVEVPNAQIVTHVGATDWTASYRYPTRTTYVRFEVFTAVTMKNGVFWVLTRATLRNNPEDTIL
jgi:hypothetical protein